MNKDNILCIGEFKTIDELPDIDKIFHNIPKDKTIIASVCNDIYLYDLQDKVWMKIAESDYYSDEQLLNFALELLNITKTDLISILKGRRRGGNY